MQTELFHRYYAESFDVFVGTKPANSDVELDLMNEHTQN